MKDCRTVSLLACYLPPLWLKMLLDQDVSDVWFIFRCPKKTAFTWTSVKADQESLLNLISRVGSIYCFSLPVFCRQFHLILIFLQFYIWDFSHWVQFLLLNFWHELPVMSVNRKQSCKRLTSAFCAFLAPHSAFCYSLAISEEEVQVGLASKYWANRDSARGMVDIYCWQRCLQYMQISGKLHSVELPRFTARC